MRVAFRNLSHQKTRTALTLLGVIIGIASVVALVSTGSGLEASVKESLESLGPNRLIITPQGSAGFGPPVTSQGLSEKDLRLVENNRKVEKSIPIVFKSIPVKYGDETRSVFITGVPAEQAEDFFSDVQTFDLAEGRSLNSGDSSVAVVGSRLAKDIFSSDIRIRSKLTMIEKDIRVVGILKPTGNQQDDNGIIMPINTLREISGNKEEISVIMAKVREDPKSVAVELEEDLRDLHKEKLFVVLTTEQLINQINSVFGLISLVLVGIAAISLLVAGFGIMNTMLMAVIERTREIGVMKALGATNQRILGMFMLESSVVGLLGGIAGTVVGYAISFGLAGASVSFLGLSLSVMLDMTVISGVLAFSTAVGAVSGSYPAWRAARLDPIEALRYE